VSDEEFASDLEESICFLLRDGDSYSFLHRSFQEYFTALFLAQRQLEHSEEIIEAIANKQIYDNVLSLLVDMNREAFETKYFKRKLKEFEHRLSKIDIEKNPREMYRLLYNALHIDLLDEENDIAIGHADEKEMEHYLYIAISLLFG
jgi:hypothetical protein